MSDDNSDDRDVDRSETAWLATLRRLLESFDSQSDPDDQGLYDVAYGISIETGLGSGEDEPRRRTRPESRASTTDHGRPRSASHRHHATTRRYPEELIVTVDVPGVEPAAITAGVTDGTLVVLVEGTEVSRVEIPWSTHHAGARLNNDVLTVTVNATDDRHRLGESQGDRP